MKWQQRRGWSSDPRPNFPRAYYNANKYWGWLRIVAGEEDWIQTISMAISELPVEKDETAAVVQAVARNMYALAIERGWKKVNGRKWMPFVVDEDLTRRSLYD